MQGCDYAEEAVVTESEIVRTEIIEGLLTDRELDQLFIEGHRAKYLGAFKREKKAHRERKRLEKNHWHEEAKKRNPKYFERQYRSSIPSNEPKPRMGQGLGYFDEQEEE